MRARKRWKRRESGGNDGKAVEAALGIFCDKKFLAGGSIKLALPQGAGAPDKIFCTGAGTRAPAHLLGSPTRRRDFGGTGAGQFLARSLISAPAAFWEAF
jgi:hypothetical protein